jgi:hypothetical protein
MLWSWKRRTVLLRFHGHAVVFGRGNITLALLMDGECNARAHGLLTPSGSLRGKEDHANGTEAGVEDYGTGQGKAKHVKMTTRRNTA